MTEDTIIRAASRGEMPNESMTCPELCLYYAMNDLYKRFNLGTITKADGEKMKTSAIKQYNKDVEEYGALKNELRRIGNFFRDIEFAGSNYRLNPTIENADAFLESVYGCGRMKR